VNGSTMGHDSWAGKTGLMAIRHPKTYHFCSGPFATVIVGHTFGAPPKSLVKALSSSNPLLLSSAGR